MAISINWSSKVITVPQADLTLISGSLYELDVDVFRLALKDIEDSEEGVVFLDTHRHNTQVTLSGVTYARTFEIINGYTVTFEAGMYTVRCVGANHNLADVKNINSVSLIIGNSAGLISVSSGSGLSPAQDAALTAIKAKTDELTFTNVGELDANTKSVNDEAIIGNGSTGDKFRSHLVP